MIVTQVLDDEKRQVILRKSGILIKASLLLGLAFFEGEILAHTAIFLPPCWTVLSSASISRGSNRPDTKTSREPTVIPSVSLPPTRKDGSSLRQMPHEAGTHRHNTQRPRSLQPGNHHHIPGLRVESVRGEDLRCICLPRAVKTVC